MKFDGAIPVLLQAEDRRKKVRICEPFPVRIRGVDADGAALEVDAVLDNLSGGGLYVRMPRRVGTGAQLLADIHLSTRPARAMRVQARGTVLRSERQPDGRYGIAVAFQGHRYL